MHFKIGTGSEKVLLELKMKDKDKDAPTIQKFER
jgi:hypothetical protein